MSIITTLLKIAESLYFELLKIAESLQFLFGGVFNFNVLTILRGTDMKSTHFQNFHLLFWGPSEGNHCILEERFVIFYSPHVEPPRAVDIDLCHLVDLTVSDDCVLWVRGGPPRLPVRKQYHRVYCTKAQGRNLTSWRATWGAGNHKKLESRCKKTSQRKYYQNAPSCFS